MEVVGGNANTVRLPLVGDQQSESLEPKNPFLRRKHGGLPAPPAGRRSAVVPHDQNMYLTRSGLLMEVADDLPKAISEIPVF